MGQVGGARLRRRHRARQSRPGRRCLPHRRPHVLRRRRARRRYRRAARVSALPDGSVRPSREEFGHLGSEYRVVPVTRRLLADGETPVGVYRKLAGNRAGTFLLESAEHGRVWSRYSFVGVRCAATLTERDGVAEWVGTPPAFAAEHEGGDPLVALRDTVERLRTPRLEGLPPLTGGLVGYVSYDAV